MKVVIALLIMAAVVLVVFVLAKRLSPGASARDGKGKGADARAETTRGLVPAAFLKGPVLVQRDGTAVSYVKVACKNNSLCSVSELMAEARSTAAALVGQTRPFKLVHIQRPVDPSAEILRFERLAAETQRIADAPANNASSRRAKRQAQARLSMQRYYLSRLRLEAKRGARMRSEAYFVLPVAPCPGSENLAYQRAKDLKDALKAAGYDAAILYGEEIVSFSLAYAGAHRTASENHDPHAITPLVAGFNGIERTVFSKEETDDRQD